MNGNVGSCEIDNGSSLGYIKSKPYSAADANARSQRIDKLLRNIDEKRNKHLEVFNVIIVF